MSDRQKKAITVRRVRDRMIVAYTLFLVALVVIGVWYLYIHLFEIAVKNSAAQNEALAMRVSEAVDIFCEDAESDCNRVFKQQKVMEFDPILNDYPSYESSRLKNEVRNELLELAAGRSYNDFFVVFSDTQTVGKVSSSADSYILKRAPASISELLSGANDAWMFSPSGGSRKMYYLRRMTDHSAVVISCYIDEIEPIVVSDGAGSDEIYVVLTDKKDRVILSGGGKEQTGQQLSPELADRFTSANETAVSDDFIGTVVTTRSGWKVYTVSRVPLRITDNSVVTGGGFLILLSLVCVSVLVGFLSVAGLRGSEIAQLDSEYNDPISGRLNEYGLDEKISERIETSLIGSTYAFILIGIKDYDTIRQTVSLAFRRSMIEGIVDISESYFSERRFLIGRISGDRLIMFVDFSEFDLFRSHDKLTKECAAFAREFENFTADSASSLKIGVNIGVCVYPDHAEDYDSLLAKAETAYAQAEKKDGSAAVVYKPENNGGKDGDGV